MIWHYFRVVWAQPWIRGPWRSLLPSWISRTPLLRQLPKKTPSSWQQNRTTNRGMIFDFVWRSSCASKLTTLIVVHIHRHFLHEWDSNMCWIRWKLLSIDLEQSCPFFGPIITSIHKYKAETVGNEESLLMESLSCFEYSLPSFHLHLRWMDVLSLSIAFLIATQPCIRLHILWKLSRGVLLWLYVC